MRMMGKVDMARSAHLVLLAAVLLAAVLRPVAADEGADLFTANCQGCHTTLASEPQRQGPTLAGIVGRPAGRVEGFPYSAGLKAADWVWTPDILDKWITHPQAMVKDSYMMFSQPDAAIRTRIVAFLETLKP